jgi:hypothetical protein
MSRQIEIALIALLLGAACQPAYYGYHAPLPEAPAGISGEAWTHALAAHDRAARRGLTSRPLLAVIDYSLPSTERRLWVVNLETGEVLAHEYVAHAVASGGVWATAFSNRDGSRQSSLGTFLTAGRYIGVRGLSLRLHGLEPGINDRAWVRGIVLHGTPNVTPERARRGALGRTDGCPAVSVEAARRLIPLLEDGAVLFVWYPDPNFLARSAFVDQGAAAVRLSAGN